MPHTLPSSIELSSFTAFYKQATLLKSGEATVIFSLPQESVAAILDLARNDGLALNITVWGTKLDDDDDADGLAGLKQLLGDI